MNAILRTMFAAIVLAGVSAASVVVAAEGVTVPVRHLQILPDPDERGRVLGVNTTVPVITKISARNGLLVINTPRGSVTVRPYRNYHGNIWARKVDFGEDLGIIYVTAPLGQYAFGDIKAYDMYGAKVAVEKIGGAYVGSGIQAGIAVDPATNAVFLAAGSKSGSKTVSIFDITPVGSVLLQHVTLPVKATNLRLSILAANGTTGIIATPDARTHSLRLWEYHPDTNVFFERQGIQQSAYRITQYGIAERE